MKNPYLSYQSQSIQTMTHGEMIQALYEGLLKYCHLAIVYIHDAKVKEAHNAIVRAQDIVLYMTQTLNPSVEVSSNLFLMYDFFAIQLTKANVEKSASPLMQIIPMIEELRDTFKHIDKAQRMQSIAK